VLYESLTELCSAISN